MHNLSGPVSAGWRKIISKAIFHYNLGNAQKTQGKLNKAMEHYNAALNLKPDFPEAHFMMGMVSQALGKFDAAIKHYQDGLRMKPDCAEVHYNLGIVLAARRELDFAIEHYQEAIRLKPDFSGVYNNLGLVLQDKGRFDAAIAHYQEAIRLKPDSPEAYNNLGNALKAQGKLDAAIEQYREAIRVNPQFFKAHNNLGTLFQEQGKSGQAINAYKKALRLQPNSAEVYANLGTAYQDQGKLDKAIQIFRQALGNDPKFVEGHSNLLLSLNYHPSIDPAQVFTEHQRWAEQHALPLADMIKPHVNDSTPDRRLRIGYISPDFRLHSVAFFIEPIIAAHDRTEFKIFCYSDVARPDAVTKRLQSVTDTWRNILGQSHEQVCDQVRNDCIDILVDLAGHTAHNRMPVFARKPAPVQVTYLGYPNTTGLPTIDYRITDDNADPIGQTDAFHSEELLRLPNCFLCYKPHKDSPDVASLPALKTGHVTFGSFNNLSKVTPEVITVWSEIMREMPRSRLVMKAKALAEPETRQRIHEMFVRNGVISERVKLIGQVPFYTDHLSLCNTIDIGLDTFPYNGTTTTCEALWMGVPVIVLKGRIHASRVGVSLLSCIGLTELISESTEKYVEKAIQLAGDLNRLQELRANLRSIMMKLPLMDSRGFTSSLEQAYRQMWYKWAKETGDRRQKLGDRSESQDVCSEKKNTSAESSISERASTFNQHGENSFNAGHLAEAMAAFQKAIEIEPNYVVAHNNLGVLHWHTGEVKEASECFKRALEIDPGHRDTILNLNEVLQTLKQGDGCDRSNRSNFSHVETFGQSNQAIVTAPEPLTEKQETKSESTETGIEWIFVVGMPRSGSTWTYNVIRSILAVLGPGTADGYVGEGDAVDAHLRSKSAGVCNKWPGLIKFHGPTEQVVQMLKIGRARAIYSQRDLRDVTVSLMDFDRVTFEQIVDSGRLDAIMKTNLFWRHQPNLMKVEYQEIMRKPEDTVCCIAAWLNYSITDSQAKEIANNCSLNASRRSMERLTEQLSDLKKEQLLSYRQRYYDKNTLVHYNHIKSGEIGRYRKCLTDAQIARFYSMLGDWLVQEGYEQNLDLCQGDQPVLTQPSETCLTVRMKGDIKVCLPRSIQLLTPYVLLEQEDWFEDEIEFIRHLLKPGMQVIDIGANYGVYTLTMAKIIGPTGKVWAFEPASTTAAFLNQSIKLNLMNNILLTQAGLSNRKGTAKLKIEPNSELNYITNHPDSDTTCETIQLLSIDDCEMEFRWNDIDFIKLDAEGEESNIVKGAAHFLSSQSPLIMFELKHGNKVNLQLINQFAEIGYGTYRYVNGLNLLAPFDLGEALDPYQLNLFCCKTDRARLLEDQGLLSPSLSSESSLPDTDRTAWQSYINVMPYGRKLMLNWKSLCQSSSLPGWKQYQTGLNYYVAAHLENESPQVRYTSLRQAQIELNKAIKILPNFSRLQTLARVLLELGLRSSALKTINLLLSIFDSHQQLNMNEPFMPVSSKFDFIDPADQIGRWCLASILEQREKSQAFSSYFTGNATIKNLEHLRSLGFQAPEMERRRQLIKMRFGLQNCPELSPVLKNRSADNLNPSFWKGELVSEEAITINQQGGRSLQCRAH